MFLVFSRIPWIAFVIAIYTCNVNAQNNPITKPPVIADVRKLGSPSSTVLVSHGSACLVQQSYDWASQLNKWGYNAVVIDHCTTRRVRQYTQTGGPPLNLQPEDKALDYIAIARWLEKEDWHKGKIAVIGFSMGGTGVLKLIDAAFSSNQSSGAIKIHIDAAVAFYPECKVGRPPPQPSIPTLIHHGQSDELALSRRCKYEELKHHNYQILLYEGAHHTFDDNGYEISGRSMKGETKTLRRYDREADIKSRSATKAFLGQHLDTVAK